MTKLHSNWKKKKKTKLENHYFLLNRKSFSSDFYNIRTPFLGLLSEKAGPLRVQFIYQMKDHVLNYEKNIILACAFLCDFLDCHLNSNMQIIWNSLHAVGIEYTKISKKFQLFCCSPSFCSCFTLCLGLADQKIKFGAKWQSWKKSPIFLIFPKMPE